MAGTATALPWFVRHTTHPEDLGRGPAELLDVLRAHARRTGRAWPRQETLARELGRSVRTVRSWLRELEGRGLIEVRRTGRSSVVTFPTAPPSERQERPVRSAGIADRIEGQKGTGEQNRSVVPPSPIAEPVTTTAVFLDEAEELPDAGEVRHQLAEAREVEAACPPGSPERSQARQRVAALHTLLAHVGDVQRAAEALREVPGHGGHRGTGGVSSLADLWRLRMVYASMPSEDFVRSVLRWCAHHRKYPGRRIGSLDGWLARERFEPVAAPELVPLPEVPQCAAAESAAESAADDSAVLVKCGGRGGCFWSAVLEEPPAACPRCGSPISVCA